MSGRSAPPGAGGELVSQEAAAAALAGQALALAGLAAAAAGYMRDARAPSTNRAYAADWAHVARWCAAQGRGALPMDPETLGLYCTAYGPTLAPDTLVRRLSAITAVHQAAGHPAPCGHPTVRAVLAGIRRRHARPPRRATPLVVDAMRAVLAVLDDSPRGRRDRAMLLLGWGGALRRGELVGLDRRDIETVAEGVVLTVRRSKTLRPGDVRVIGVPRHPNPAYDPATCWEEWQDIVGDRAVPAFRAIDPTGAIYTRRLCDRQVARLVARVAAQAGLQGAYSGHSLRAGAATAAAELGAPLHAVMALTGHKSAEMALRYVRPTSLFRDNAAAIAAL